MPLSKQSEQNDKNSKAQQEMTENEFIFPNFVR
jgi:hypothetical protein